MPVAVTDIWSFCVYCGQYNPALSGEGLIYTTTDYVRIFGWFVYLCDIDTHLSVSLPLNRHISAIYTTRIYIYTIQTVQQTQSIHIERPPS